jgi:hypothetical protein
MFFMSIFPKKGKYESQQILYLSIKLDFVNFFLDKNTHHIYGISSKFDLTQNLDLFILNLLYSLGVTLLNLITRLKEIVKNSVLGLTVKTIGQIPPLQYLQAMIS